MKRYISVFEMITRSSIYKVLGILLLMTGAETVMLIYAWNRPLAMMQPNLEEWIDQSAIIFPFWAAYWMVTKVLAFAGTNTGSMQGYTLQRLRIPEKKVHLLQSIYNILCYLILWVTQLSVLLVASAYYINHKTGVVLTNQTVFLAFNRNEFMHSVFPLEDYFGWFAIAFFIVGTGIQAAVFSRKQRSGKTAWSLAVFIVLAVVCFPRELGEEPILMIMVMLIWGLYAIIQAAANKGVQEDES